ncbi:hypothetical protein BDK51DRAFT_32039 [Blyttiomyces helicus]|uniref:Uncharacterized protein n=1 Tax=Blyttiomyces helicus TaxID=388810 RepID=A0A4P9W1U5_9FUNG|nr:hypothetical protein BDK51DRAFT_32039 [Blyttiomyces helicus]|eukprot:RKO84728.1 hypothetical protein BDK51DRAFT_32039 [Blyttiomyces helicus]
MAIVPFLITGSAVFVGIIVRRRQKCVAKENYTHFRTLRQQMGRAITNDVLRSRHHHPECSRSHSVKVKASSNSAKDQNFEPVVRLGLGWEDGGEFPSFKREGRLVISRGYEPVVGQGSAGEHGDELGMPSQIYQQMQDHNLEPSVKLELHREVTNDDDMTHFISTLAQFLRTEWNGGDGGTGNSGNMMLITSGPQTDQKEESSHRERRTGRRDLNPELSRFHSVNTATGRNSAEFGGSIATGCGEIFFRDPCHTTLMARKTRTRVLASKAHDQSFETMVKL